jgi:hypothetical protein
MSYPSTYPVEPSEKLTRLLLIIRILFGWLYVGIPHGIILWLYEIGVGIIQLSSPCCLLVNIHKDFLTL